MNLGQSFGEMRLRILQLEDELEARGCVIPPPIIEARPLQPAVVPAAGSEEPPPVLHMVMAPPGRGGNNRGIGKRVYEAIPDEYPGETVGEIAAILGDTTSQRVAAWVTHFHDVVRTGERGTYRYYRRKAA
jgi:hypothetical protein